MPAIMRGVVYPSIKAAAKAAGRSERNANLHLRTFGHLDYLGMQWPIKRVTHRKPVEIFGLTFPSQAEASRVLGVDRKTIRSAAHNESARARILRAAMQFVDRGGDGYTDPHRSP